MIISVIIPCYNSATTIENCIKSILNQTYQNFEIIIIDDGSNDDTKEEIVRIKDDRIIYVYQKNQGVSAARNVGIRKANGKFIAFVDSDDSLSNTMFQEMMSSIIIDDYDLVICQTNANSKTNSLSNIIPKDKLVEAFNCKGVDGYLWNKLFKASIIKNNNLFLDENIHFMEDLLFCINYTQYIKTNAFFINKVLYEYKPLPHSITSSSFSKKKFTGIYSLEEILTIVDGSDEAYNNYYSYYYHFMLSLLVNGKSEKKINKNEIDIIRDRMLKCDLRKITSKKVFWSIKISKISVNIYYIFWKFIKKGFNYDKKIN